MFLPSNITLQFGDSGDFVMELQRRLVAVNAHTEGGINGFFDGPTVNSVSSFQSRHGLRADGVAGPETLRRLNGVIAGDTGGTTSSSGSANNEEEERLRLAQQQQMTAALLEQQAQTPAGMLSPGAAEAEHMAAVNTPQPLEAASALGIAATTAALAPELTGANPAQAMAAQQRDMMMQQQMMQAQQQQQTQGAPAGPSAGELLAQMLLQQTQATQQAPQQQAQAPQPQAAATAQTAATEPEKQPGIIGRAIQKLDAFAQKMAAYFEAKLSPDTLHEVRQIGAAMLQNGVREVAIPGGPEQARGPAAPARGPEQQPQIPQR